MAGGLRRGIAGDVRGLIRMHAECSDTTVRRRFLSPLPTMSSSLALQLLTPPGGFSLVADRGGRLAAVITVAPDQPGSADAEAGLLVADAWQRRGIGTALLSMAVREAPRAGFTALHLRVLPDNPAVVAMIAAAGLRARVSSHDGVTQIVVPLAPSSPGAALALG